MRPRRLAATASALLVAACWSGVGAAAADPTPPPTPPPGPKTVIDHDGTYAVGTDILPGTYSTPGPTEGNVCYWKRVQGDQMLDNNMSKKAQVVRIEPTDTAFRTTRCQPWQLTDCPPTCAPAQQPVLGLPDVLKGIPLLPPQPPPAAGGH
ncbi:hypothetical protein KIH27_08985 [Mycobacterium sp. M1]|uniref:Lipoprotein n=1 Tax=Mycolicibacter acidiphilus TaxID=2835306 RepID=A0ABS5RLA0_9MYCO|nr:hypothetical protein [Mycolicibacter acidiphilus]MBS9533719.1 hypothetical protein [Mycolicibacter acidiphilus]